MLLESRGYITSHPRVNKRVQQAEEGLPYLHLTYFILWESSILKGKERRRNCWGGLLEAGWATVFKEADKWEIWAESTKRVNTLFSSLAPHQHQLVFTWNVSTHSVPTSCSCSATWLVSHFVVVSWNVIIAVFKLKKRHDGDRNTACIYSFCAATLINPIASAFLQPAALLELNEGRARRGLTCVCVPLGKMPANVLRLPVTPLWRTPRGGETPPRGGGISTAPLSGEWPCGAGTALCWPAGLSPGYLSRQSKHL